MVTFEALGALQPLVVSYSSRLVWDGIEQHSHTGLDRLELEQCFPVFVSQVCGAKKRQYDIVRGLRTASRRPDFLFIRPFGL